ncbi:MAG TPA: DNA primase, partial [Microcoleaceae bacterium UBA11344]|nr:DNA primase [Microcoleaceae cyanobacterium UBA11344]
MNNLRVDRTQASKHLEYLGYRPGDNIYLRFFYHSSDPRKNDDRGRKESLLSWEKIEKYQSDGRGVYVVVNGADGGHTDAEIKQCCAIFCEWDDISLAEQFEKWSYLGFVEPTFTVYSGDKSMQPYWVFDEPIAPKQWRYLQNLLIEVMKADKSNKNPSRVFRLAG